jgi:hypothetical protein
LEGDSNTKYFQLVASEKYRKTRIFQLQHGDRIIEGDQALKEAHPWKDGKAKFVDCVNI